MTRGSEPTASRSRVTGASTARSWLRTCVTSCSLARIRTAILRSWKHIGSRQQRPLSGPRLSPTAFAQKHGPRFEEFLQRVLMHSAPLSAPKDVAWHLASYAREALARVEGGEVEALARVRTA